MYWAYIEQGIPCKCIVKMILRHYRTPNQCVCILWNWIRIAWVNIIVDGFNVECVLGESTSTGNGRNINVEPLEGTGIICWNKYTGFLTSSDDSNYFRGFNSWNLILLMECIVIRCHLQITYNFNQEFKVRKENNLFYFLLFWRKHPPRSLSTLLRWGCNTRRLVISRSHFQRLVSPIPGDPSPIDENWCLHTERNLTWLDRINHSSCCHTWIWSDFPSMIQNPNERYQNCKCTQKT